MPSVDAVVVTYNSARTIQGCLRALVDIPQIEAFVVDNASSDETVALASSLPVRVERLIENRGFSYGNNVGMRLGRAPFVLFLNPDATIDQESLRKLVDAFKDDETAIVAPRILNTDGSVSFSLRRFPRLRSTFAQALFLHRLFPRASWTDEVVRDVRAYEVSGSPDWVSGACMLVRREMLSRVGGWDSGFFLYGEDIDLCRRVRRAGGDICFVPDAIARHEGGASGPRAALMPVLAASRIRYAQKHQRPVVRELERLGVALGALTHLIVAPGGLAARGGHLRALTLAVMPTRPRVTVPADPS